MVGQWFEIIYPIQSRICLAIFISSVTDLGLIPDMKSSPNFKTQNPKLHIAAVKQTTFQFHVKRQAATIF